MDAAAAGPLCCADGVCRYRSADAAWPGPEVLDAVDVTTLVGEQLRLVDPYAVKLRYVEHIATAESIGINHAARPNLVAVDRDKRDRSGICDDYNIVLAMPFEKSKHRY